MLLLSNTTKTATPYHLVGPITIYLYMKSLHCYNTLNGARVCLLFPVHYPNEYLCQRK